MDEAPHNAGGARLGFGRERRLRRRAEFREVYETGRRARGRFATVFCRKRPTSGEREEPWRLGITATKKTGNAVERNRQRRRVRSFFRLNQHRIPEGWDFVVNTRPELGRARFEEVSRDLERTLSRLDLDRAVDRPERVTALRTEKR